MKSTTFLRIGLHPLIAALCGAAIAGERMGKDTRMAGDDVPPPVGGVVAGGSSVSRSVSVTSDGRNTVRKTTITRDGHTETVIETTGPDGKTIVTRDGARPENGQNPRTANPQPGGNRAMVGLRVKEAQAVLREQLGLDANEGVVVELVDPGGPAAAAGIIAHDILLALDGRPLGTPADLRNHLSDHKPGDKVGFSMLRKGKPGRVSVTLAPARETPENLDGPLANRRTLEEMGIDIADIEGLGEIGPGAFKIEIKGDGSDALNTLLDDPDVPESIKQLLRSASGSQERLGSSGTVD